MTSPPNPRHNVPQAPPTLTRDEALALLREHKPMLAERFGVTQLALCGSVARDEATADSDVDVLVEFAASPDWKACFGVEAYLEELFDRAVDMSTLSEVRKEIRPYVERDAVYV